MTDHPTISDDDLLLALDGEADAELLARIEAEPGATARLHAMRADAARVSAPVHPLDAGVVDELISTALDTPVAPARQADAGRRRATPWLVAASVVVLMAAGLSLVWAGRGTEQDQAGAGQSAADATGQDASDGAAESSFEESSAATDAGAAAPSSGGHGSATTIAANPTEGLPLVYLGDYPSGAALREATATSFADALRSSDTTATFNGADPPPERTTPSRSAPPEAAVDRCAQQLQITLSLETNPLQAGYATVDDRDVLVYEFAATSVRDGSETTLVAAVGQDACDEVVLFER
jgi:hypothetical protein